MAPDCISCLTVIKFYFVAGICSGYMIAGLFRIVLSYFKFGNLH